MAEFRPLDALRAIRDDETLTTTEAHVLMCMILRTDNETKKVRLSLTGIAKDAKVSRQFVSSMLKKPHVKRYFSKVERRARETDLWMKNHPSERRLSLRSDSPERRLETPRASSEMTPSASSTAEGKKGAPSGTPSARTEVVSEAPMEELSDDPSLDANAHARRLGYNSMDEYLAALRREDPAEED